MKVIAQSIKIRRIVDEVYSIRQGTKFKSILMDEKSTPEIVKAFLMRYANSPYIDEMSRIDIPQENSDIPIIQVIINFQYSDGATEDIIIWDSLKGFHKEEYENAKKKGAQIDKILQKNAYLAEVEV